jgi:uncharacterized membrane protein
MYAGIIALVCGIIGTILRNVVQNIDPYHDVLEILLILVCGLFYAIAMIATGVVIVAVLHTLLPLIPCVRVVA